MIEDYKATLKYQDISSHQLQEELQKEKEKNEHMSRYMVFMHKGIINNDFKMADII